MDSMSVPTTGLHCGIHQRHPTRSWGINMVSGTLSRPLEHVAHAMCRATSLLIRPGPQSPASFGGSTGRHVVAALVPSCLFPSLTSWPWWAGSSSANLCNWPKVPHLMLQLVDMQGAKLLCDVARGTTWPVVIVQDQQNVFQAVHGMAHLHVLSGTI
jgi:hypothetical protein